MNTNCNENFHYQRASTCGLHGTTHLITPVRPKFIQSIMTGENYLFSGEIEQYPGKMTGAAVLFFFFFFFTTTARYLVEHRASAHVVYLFGSTTFWIGSY